MTDYSIISYFDPIAYFESKNITFTTEGENTSPGWVNTNCLFCGDQANHFGISLSTNGCNCWKCGKHTIVELVQIIEKCSWGKALKVMEDFQNPAKIGLSKKKTYEEVKHEFKMPHGLKRIEADGYVPERVTKFLAERGFDPEKVLKEKELYIPMPFQLGPHRFRLLFPIRINRKLVSFMTRDVTGKARKPYIGCSDEVGITPIKHTLYGFDEAQPNSHMVIVEGIIDQWKLGPGSLATFGVGWTLEQVSLLRTLNPRKVSILYDSEEEAQRKAKELAKAIWFCDAQTFYLPGRKDPGELTIEEGQNVMKNLS